jgi:hypothetical protein
VPLLLEVWVQILVSALAHPAIAVTSHSIVLANFGELIAVLYKNELLSDAHNLARIVRVSIDAVAYIVSYFILYHFLLLFYHYEYSIAPLVKPVNLFVKDPTGRSGFI